MAEENTENNIEEKEPEAEAQEEAVEETAVGPHAVEETQDAPSETNEEKDSPVDMGKLIEGHLSLENVNVSYVGVKNPVTTLQYEYEIAALENVAKSLSHRRDTLESRLTLRMLQLKAAAQIQNDLNNVSKATQEDSKSE